LDGLNRVTPEEAVVGFEEDMRLLKERMRQLEIEWEQWFAGILPKPPWENQRVIENVIKRYSRNPPRSLSEQSVFQMYQAKFNTYSEMWNRRQRLKEEGRLPGGPEQKSRKVPPVAPATPPPNKDKMRDVFDNFVAAREQAGQSTGKLTFDAFKQQLSKQKSKLQSERGYDVDFGVTVKDGKVSLVARRKK
jgi:hypothetical protein